MQKGLTVSFRQFQVSGIWYGTLWDMIHTKTELKLVKHQLCWSAVVFYAKQPQNSDKKKRKAMGNKAGRKQNRNWKPTKKLEKEEEISEKRLRMAGSCRFTVCFLPGFYFFFCPDEKFWWKVDRCVTSEKFPRSPSAIFYLTVHRIYCSFECIHHQPPITE